MRILKHAVALGGALSVASSPAHAAWDLNLRVGVTELSRDIYHLHMLILVDLRRDRGRRLRRDDLFDRDIP